MRASWFMAVWSLAVVRRAAGSRSAGIKWGRGASKRTCRRGNTGYSRRESAGQRGFRRGRNSQPEYMAVSVVVAGMWISNRRVPTWRRWRSDLTVGARTGFKEGLGSRPARTCAWLWPGNMSLGDADMPPSAYANSKCDIDGSQRPRDSRRASSQWLLAREGGQAGEAHRGGHGIAHHRHRLRCGGRSPTAYASLIRFFGSITSDGRRASMSETPSSTDRGMGRTPIIRFG